MITLVPLALIVALCIVFFFAPEQSNQVLGQIRFLFGDTFGTYYLVTGLAFPTSGTLSLWGKSETVELQKQRKRIGSMIETPALFPAMTAYQNMEIQRIQRGIPDKTVIKRTLDMVGLNDTGKKRVRNFSLGMRQRLGIAMALLNTPEFLILDEPVNGLDKC